MSIIAPDVFDLSASSVLLPVVPMFHANSWCLPYAAAITGLKLVICADNKAERICQLFNEEGVTHSAGVPTVWLSVIDHVEDTGRIAWQAAHDPGRRVFGTAGDDPLVQASVESAFGHLWGMTEMTPIGTVGGPPPNWDSMSDEDQVAYQSRPGRAMFGVELRVVDDAGQRPFRAMA